VTAVDGAPKLGMLRSRPSGQDAPDERVPIVDELLAGAAPPRPGQVPGPIATDTASAATNPPTKQAIMIPSVLE
jgi:hypothetical protein